VEGTNGKRRKYARPDVGVFEVPPDPLEEKQRDLGLEAREQLSRMDAKSTEGGNAVHGFNLGVLARLSSRAGF
jgi:hypothetical protein